jgi:hypothetical protein
MDVYEFKEEEKALEDPNFHLTDGKVTMVLTPWKIQDYYGTEHKGPGWIMSASRSKTSRLSKAMWRF